MYLDTMNTRMLIESSSRNFDLPVNVIRYTSPANTRQSTIVRNTNYQLPDKYVVGESKLQVYIDDIMLCIGTEYIEVGNEGEESDLIQFVNWDVGVERNLEYIIIGRDYLTISINGTRAPKINNNIDITVPTTTSQLINDSNFVTARDTIDRARTAESTAGVLSIQKNGTTVATFNGSQNVSANLSIPVSFADLTGTENVILSGDDTIQDIRIISQASYDLLNKASIPNGTVYLVY